MVLVILAYTALLVYLGRLGRRKACNLNFITGGRQFSASQVFFMMSALWCSWIFVVEIESAYLFGISAVWFGVGVGIMAVAGGILMGTPLSKLSYVTTSGVLGERFGRLAGTITGLVLGITFPIFAMSNVLAAAAFIHAVMGWQLLATLVGTVAVMLSYIIYGGMWALAYVQIANLVIITIGLVVGAVFALHAVPLTAVPDLLPARYTRWNGVGTSTILVWIISDLLAVVSAQAEFQILMAASDRRQARRGLGWAMVSVGLFSILSALIGLCVKAATGNAYSQGILALPQFFLNHAPGWVSVIMALAVWASALAWSAPLMFSGASSLGADVIHPVLSSGSADRTKLCVQICLPVQAVLVVSYALVRPDHLAWWQVFSMTIRNGAIFAPTIALLVWPVVKKGAAIISMLLGSGSGLAWNVLGGFSTAHFVMGVDPVWISAIVAIVSLIVATLLMEAGFYRINVSAANSRLGWTFMVAAAGCCVLVVSGHEPPSFGGPLALVAALSVFGLCSLGVQKM